MGKAIFGVPPFVKDESGGTGPVLEGTRVMGWPVGIYVPVYIGGQGDV